ncbi:hypothetical protein SAMN05660691_00867 [Rheinheimera pacifica]|uniref:TraB family protein n=1 Tax=Rheinheimera pacifica TaxID=173990 RepID=A0A1H6K9D1_9GAMM|nr:TraB/GumN family protein [Rheinheimera pacifica]SEH68101.1 hypothetical protein SAMN05660691_00867 [Rheinheimera pacifica]
MLNVKVLCSAMLLAIGISSTALAQTSMWKVSKGTDYVYIGGTVHFLPESAFPLPVEFDAAYNATDTLVLEVKIPEPNDIAAQTKLFLAMLYKDDRSLSKVLSPDVYQQVRDYFATHGVQLQQFNGYKPGFIMLQMQALEMKKAQMAGEGVDSYFDKRAKADGKTLAYLESLESQIRLLANMGEGNEDDFMTMNLEQLDDFKNYFASMIAAWRVGDINELDKLLLEPSRALDPILYQALFVERNSAWLPKIEQMFGNDSKELVLVGGGHLAGEHSVLALLQQAGYTVEQVK